MPDHIVEVKPRPRDRVKVTLSGGRFFTIPNDAAAGLSSGLELSDEDIGRLDRLDQYFRGKEKVLRLLGIRARTRSELGIALDKIGVESTIREGLLDEFEESGLVNDERFARDFVRARTELKRQGPHRLRHDLRKLGVRRSIVDDAVSGVDAETQESMAWDEVNRRVGSATIDEKVVRRVAGMLRRKGFDYEIVNRVSYELLRRVGRDVVEE